MKPIKLILSAYGPFPDRIEIDFEKLGEDGVFLVSGATGSGKTTIFDGIVYALYGTASGNLRTPGMMRSTYAKPSVKTYAELTFKSNGRVYRIYRKPEQSVEKLRGEGFTTSPYEVSLEVVGEKTVPYTKKREVDEQVRNIIGLDANQFRQVTMIAQGEFLKVLNSTTEERIAIFSKVFKTGNYRSIQEELKGELKKRIESVNQMENKLSEAFLKTINKARPQSSGYQKLSEEQGKVDIFSDTNLNQDSFQNLSIDEKKNLIEKLLLEDRDELKILEANQGEIKKLNADTLSERIKLEKVIEQFAELEKSRIDRELIVKRKKEFEDELAIVPARKEELEKLKKQITSLEIEKPRYRNIADRRNDLAEKAESLSTLKSCIDDLSEYISVLTNKSEIKTDEVKKLEKKASTKSDIAGGITAVESLYRSVDDFLNNYNRWEGFEKEYIKESDVFLKIDAYYKEYQAFVNELESGYLKQQAGILAKNLDEGKPCPVCGSIHHPVLARIPGKEIIKEDIDIAEEKQRSIEQERNDTHSKVSNLKGRADASCNQTKMMFEKLQEEIGTFDITNTGRTLLENIHDDFYKNALAKSMTDIETLSKSDNDFKGGDLKQINTDEYRNLKENLNLLLKVLKSELCNIDKAEKSIQNIRKEIRNLEGQIQELKTKFHDQKDKYNQLVGEYNNSSEDLKYALENMEFSGLDELNARIEELRAGEKEINEEIDRISELADTLNKEWNRAEGRYITIKRLTEDRDEITVRENLNKSSRIILETDAQIQQIEKKIRLMNTIVEDEKEALEEFKCIMPNLEAAKKIRDIYANLSATCNGDLLGKEKIQLETFVQIAFLDSILVRANSRLLKMTNGRYKLVRQKTPMSRRSQTGLDLDVHDLSNDTYRSTRSLSGGESFQASLCLALGLADEIQSSSGGIAIETMFIDEGFGTLDSTALKNAVNNLIDLSKGNKMIGIISHVDYIYQRIPRRIAVKKNLEGGSTVDIQIDS
ncbi:MAG: SMC family ATPase [Clostridiales bacterium]|nr:SMC family ATPase [Clostridiales bacterium]